MTDDLYQQQLLQEAHHPHNKGTLDAHDVVGAVINASCGDRAELFLQLSDDKKTVIDAKWQGDGCIISQAGLSVLSEHIKGKSLSELRKLQMDDVLSWLGLETIAPGRTKCLMLGLAALQRALQ